MKRAWRNGQFKCKTCGSEKPHGRNGCPEKKMKIAAGQQTATNEDRGVVKRAWRNGQFKCKTCGSEKPHGRKGCPGKKMKIAAGQQTLT